jgi:cytochrome c553
MDIGMHHLHTTVVLLFLVFLLFKTILLVANKIDLLDRVRAKTKIVEMILGITILATGGYLLAINSPIAPYLWLKIVLVFIAIPLGIIGIARKKKPMAILSVLLFVYVYGMAETKSYKFKQDPVEITDSANAGQEIYTQLCVSCHGQDGKKGLYKAPDLTATALSREEKQQRILQGKGMMRGYSDQLSEEQVQTLLDYLDTL